MSAKSRWRPARTSSLGRSTGVAVFVDDSGVSRHHAHITIDDRGATLEDLGSKNGTILTAARFSRRRRSPTAPSSSLGATALEVPGLDDEHVHGDDFTVARPARSRHVLLRKRQRPHPLRGGRLRLPVVAHRRRGLNSTIAGLTNPFNPIEEFKGEYRCIASDLRNANGGQSSGPLEIDRPWDAYTDDHLGLMDHLGIEKFMVMGFCIGGPFIWNLLRRAPNRIVAAVLAQPSGSRPEMRDLFYDNNMKGWGPALVERRPDITMEMVDRFLTKMYRTNADFVFTVTRDFVRTCQTPVLILPDDIPAHPYAVAMEAAMLAPKAEVSLFPWKEPKERIPLAVRQIRSFLRAHRPTPR